MEQLLPGVQRDLRKRLAQLGRAIQQVVVKEPGPEGAAAAAAAAEQDAALQQALQEAAERIRDFQRRAEHEAQQLQLDAAMAPLIAKHAEEQAQLQQHLLEATVEQEALHRRVVELEGCLSQSQAEAASWQQRATAAQDQLDSSLQQHESTAGQLQQRLAEADARGQQLATALQEAQAAAAAQVSSLQAQLAQQQQLAEQQSDVSAASAAAWQCEKSELEREHQEQRAAWSGELELLRLQLADARDEAAKLCDRANSAEQEVCNLQRQVQRLSSELDDAHKEQQQLMAAIQDSGKRGADLEARLRAAEQEQAAARQQADDLQQQLSVANKQLKQQIALLSAAKEQHSNTVKQLEAELSDARADHASTRCSMYNIKQLLAEQERQAVASEAKQKQLQEDLAAQKQQASLLSTQLGQLQSEHVASAKAAAAAQSQAAAAAAEMRAQLADARRAAELALQEVAQEKLGCESQVQLLKHTQEQQMAAVVAEAAAKLAQEKEAAEALLAAREAVLQQQLEIVVAGREQERQQLVAQHASAAEAQAGQWDALCAQLSTKLQQLGDNLGSHPHQVQLSPEDAELALLPASEHAQQGARAAGNACPPPRAAEQTLPAAMAQVHSSLRGLYAAALDVRAAYGSAVSQVAALQETVASLRQQLVQEKQQWEQRLERELRQHDVSWDLKCSEQVAAVLAEWRAKLAASEDRLHAELAQVTRTLQLAQHNRQELEQQCSQLASELLEAQQQAAEALEAAAARAAAQQQQAKQEAAEAAQRAAEQQERAEAALRQEMQGALARLGEQQTAALAAASAQHRQQLEEAHLLAEQAAQHHKQELKRVDDAWQLRWAGEAARLQQLHGEELAAAGVKHRQAVADVEQRHGREVAQLKDAIASVEKSERQLLKHKEVLEARVAELEAMVEAAQEQAVADAEAARLALAAAVAAAHTDLQQQVKELLLEKSALLDRIAALQDRIGKEPRHADLAAIASLEAEVGGLQKQLATAEQRYRQLRQELLLREETYNRKFAAGGAGDAMSVSSAAQAQAGLVDWMLKAGGGGAAKGTHLPALGSGRGAAGGRR